MRICFELNGRPTVVDAEPTLRLSTLLREMLSLTGLKEGCCEGECGACTVLLEGAPVHACLTLAFQIEGLSLTTVEGLAEESGLLSGLQQAFLEAGAVQCGFCTPGMIMAAEGLLAETPEPEDADIRHALAGNICRCTGFETIVRAIVAEAARRRKVAA